MLYTRPADWGWRRTAASIAMAYLVFTSHDEELDRRELSGKLIIGRSPECDVAIRDILLSRRHCQIERTDTDWIVLDLGSKNGTFLNGQQITRHKIEDGDVLRVGRCRIHFHAGPFQPAPPGTKKRQSVRPADPKEALAGTIAGMEIRDSEPPPETPGYMPQPQPKPLDRKSRSARDPQTVLEQIDSQPPGPAAEEDPLSPDRPLPRPILNDLDGAPRRMTSEVDLSLQVQSQTAVAETLPTPSPSLELQPPAPARSLPFWALAALTVLAGGATIALAVLLTWR